MQAMKAERKCKTPCVRLWIMDGVCEVERNSNRKNVDKEHRDGEKGIWG